MAEPNTSRAQRAASYLEMLGIRPRRRRRMVEMPESEPIDVQIGDARIEPEYDVEIGEARMEPLANVAEPRVSQRINNLTATLPEFLSEPFYRAARDEGATGRAIRWLANTADRLRLPDPNDNDTLEAIQTFGERAADALPLGFGDEIGYQIVDPFNTRAAHRERYLDQRALRSVRHPIASGAGSIVGSLPAAVLTPASRASTAARRIGQAALTNAGVGAVTGAGIADDGQRLESGLRGGVVGGVLGTGGQVVGEGVGAVGRWLANRGDTARRALDAVGPIAGRVADITEGPQQADAVRRLLAATDAPAVTDDAIDDLVRARNAVDDVTAPQRPRAPVDDDEWLGAVPEPRPTRPAPTMPEQGPSLRAAALRGERSFGNRGDAALDPSIQATDELSAMARDYADIEGGVGGFQPLKDRRIAEVMEQSPPRGDQVVRTSVPEENFPYYHGSDREIGSISGDRPFYVSPSREAAESYAGRSADAPLYGIRLSDDIRFADEDDLINAMREVDPETQYSYPWEALDEYPREVPRLLRERGFQAARFRDLAGDNAFEHDTIAVLDPSIISARSRVPFRSYQPATESVAPGWQSASRSIINQTRARLDAITRHAGADSRIVRNVAESRFNLDEAERLLDAAEQMGRPVQPSEVYRFLNRANMGVGRAAAAEARNTGSGMQHTTAFAEPLTQSYQNMRSFLMDPQVWGRATEVQRSLNATTAPLLRTGRALRDRLGTLFQDSGEMAANGGGFRTYETANPEAVRSMLRRVGDDAYEGERRLLRAWIENYGQQGATLARIADDPALAPRAAQIQERATRLLDILDRAEVDGRAAELLRSVQGIEPGWRLPSVGTVVRTLSRIEAGELTPQALPGAVQWLERIERAIGAGSARTGQIQPVGGQVLRGFEGAELLRQRQEEPPAPTEPRDPYHDIPGVAYEDEGTTFTSTVQQRDPYADIPGVVYEDDEEVQQRRTR